MVESMVEKKDASLNAFSRLANDGFIRIYGAGQLLAELRLKNPAFRPIRDGKTKAYKTSGYVRASGEAILFQIVAADGVFVMFNGTVATESADLILSSVMLVEGEEVIIDSVTLRSSVSA